MKKVYLVWQGEYSDRMVIAAFTSKKEADKYSNLMDELERDTIGSCYVTDIELNKQKVKGNPKVVTYYSVSIWLDSNEGHTEGDIEEMYSFEEKDIYTKDVIYEVSDVDEYNEGSYLEVKSIHGYEHAKKCALDRYYKIKAEKEGIV